MLDVLGNCVGTLRACDESSYGYKQVFLLTCCLQHPHNMPGSAISAYSLLILLYPWHQGCYAWHLHSRMISDTSRGSSSNGSSCIQAINHDGLPVCSTVDGVTRHGGTWSRVYDGTDWTPPRWRSHACATEHEQLDLSARTSELDGKRIVLLGDSMMARTVEAVAELLGHALGQPCQLTREGDRCGEATGVLGLQAPEWSSSNGNGHIEPGPGEGPAVFGLGHPGCRDCSGCTAHFYSCGTFRLDFITVEWARDVELQSRRYNTTQEVVVKEHFGLDPPSLVVFNTGVHDLQLVPQHGWQPYSTHLRWYAAMLLAQHVPLVYVTTASIDETLVPEEHRHHTSENNIKRANKIASSIMQELRISYLDTFPLSSGGYPKTLHLDAVHFSSEYYQAIAQIVLKHVSAVFSPRSVTAGIAHTK